MSKKLIIMIGAGLVSFAGAFAFSWFTKTPSVSQSPEAKQAIPASQEADIQLPQPATVSTGVAGTIDSQMKKTMTEKQLKNLVYEVRERIQEYNNKLQSLEVQEQRLQSAQNTLKEDIEELKNLQTELSSTVAALKSEHDKLLKTRVEIVNTEKKNLQSIAAAYDKMDSEAAGKILANMSKAENDNANDAVRILYYMTERAKAKLLAGLTTSEPKLAAFFTQRLKQIVEKE